MKYPGPSGSGTCPSTLFCEQVGTVTSLFEQWNDCECTVVLYALLKRVPFSNLKFLQLSIEYNLAQNYNHEKKLITLEDNANNEEFLTKLIKTYKSSNENKEDILNDILTYLPLLKPGNEKSKLIYLSLIPIIVNDSVQNIVPLELVQQILSYLLIHPAVTNEDRR